VLFLSLHYEKEIITKSVMTLIYSSRDDLDINIEQLLNDHGVSPDLWVNETSERDVEKVLSGLTHGDFMVVTDFMDLEMSIKNTLSFIRSAVSRNVRLLLVDIGLIIDNDNYSKSLISGMELALCINHNYISGKTRRALNNAKSEGKVLGRRVGWRKNVL